MTENKILTFRLSSRCTSPIDQVCIVHSVKQIETPVSGFISDKRK